MHEKITKKELEFLSDNECWTLAENTPINLISFSWKNNRIETNISYSNRTSDYYMSEEVPPTLPSHDISHIICGFMEKMEWNYRKVPNHIEEYNAVALETILSSYCFYTNIKKVEPPISMCAEHAYKHLRWFAKDYYRIQSTHPSKKRYKILLKEFLDKLEIHTVERHFLNYENVYIHERSVKGKKYEIDVTMLYDNDYKNENLVNYLYDMKKSLYKKAKSWF